MKIKIVALLAIVAVCNAGFTQEDDLTSKLYGTYDNYKEQRLNKRRIKHHELQPLIEKYATDQRFKVNKVGESIEGRDLNLISIGSGKTNVFLWSQMHGDEPTATQAIFDIFNFVQLFYQIYK